MDSGRLIRPALFAATLWCAMFSSAGTSLAALFSEFVDPNPAPGNQFGHTVLPLSTGNVVITSPYDDAGGADAGAVYLFNGATGALISTLRGASSSDQIGLQGVTALSNGNFVFLSPNWNNGAVFNAGACTWGSGTSGVTGVVSAANSVVGTTDSTSLQRVIRDDVNGTFIARFLSEGGGRVRVGLQSDPNVDVADNLAPAQLAIGVRPNPAHGNALHVAFALPTAGAARLELLDVSGRRVLAREVGWLGNGQHTVNLLERRKVAPGIYWVRLTRGASQQRARVAVIE